jgi:hypothetical protein
MGTKYKLKKWRYSSIMTHSIIAILEYFHNMYVILSAIFDTVMLTVIMLNDLAQKVNP